MGQARLDPVPSQPALCLPPQKLSSGSPPLPPGRLRSWKKKSGVTGLSRWVLQGLSSSLWGRGSKGLGVGDFIAHFTRACLKLRSVPGTQISPQNIVQTQAQRSQEHNPGRGEEPKPAFYDSLGFQ